VPWKGNSRRSVVPCLPPTSHVHLNRTIVLYIYFQILLNQDRSSIDDPPTGDHDSKLESVWDFVRELKKYLILKKL
jgi:hypothetical protein